MHFGEKEFAALHDRRIWDAYQANDLSIYVRGGIWWFERCPSSLMDQIVRVRMAEVFPELNYLEDVAQSQKI